MGWRRQDEFENLKQVRLSSVRDTETLGIDQNHTVCTSNLSIFVYPNQLVHNSNFFSSNIFVCTYLASKYAKCFGDVRKWVMIFTSESSLKIKIVFILCGLLGFEKVAIDFEKYSKCQPQYKQFSCM